MVAVLDILEDVNQKFTGTVVMYKDKAVMVKGVCNDPEHPGQFLLQTAAPNARSLEMVNLLDPALNYQRFNIGYCNGGHWASWWYRKPFKQWAQGLRGNQMGWKVGQAGVGPHDNFTFSKPFIAMLENRYPSPEECKHTLLQKYSQAVAFHKDFALSYDELHEDFLLEYRGTRIGTSVDKDLKQFKIKPDAKHLVEALQEARNVHP